MFDDPTTVEAMALYATLIMYAAPPQARERSGDRLSGVTVTWGENPGLVQSAQVAMWVDEYQHHVEVRPPAFSYGVALLPAGAAPFPASTRALYVSANATDPEACWEWIAYLSTQPEAARLLPVRRDVAASGAWRGRVGQETAEAWLAILARPRVPHPAWYTDPVADRALYWFDEALAQVFDGAAPASALAEAQEKASAFVGCIEENGEDDQAWRTCVRRADPAVVLPDR